MAVPKKNTEIFAPTVDKNGNNYQTSVAKDGPDKGKILYVVKVPSLEPLSYEESNKIYQENKESWDTSINNFLTADNLGNPAAAPTFSGFSDQNLYNQYFTELQNGQNATQTTFNPGVGGANTPLSNLAGAITSTAGLSPTTISPAPSTTGKVYVFPQDLNVGKYGSSTNGNTPQDYIRIGAVKYQPPQPGLITEGNIFNKTLTIAPNIVGKGLASLNASLPKNLQFLGEVILPMPLSVTDGAKTEWGISKMSVMGASMAAALGGAYGTGLLGNAAEFANLLGVGGNLAAAGTLTGYSLNAYLQKAAGNPGAADALRADVISNVVSKVTSTPVEPGDLLTRSTGSAVNPNAELLFRSPSLRTFDLQWKLTPRSKEEASLIRKIIRFFKINMLPTIPQQSQVLLQSPNVFVLRYEKSNGNYNESLPKPKLCALGQITVNHTPDGVGWAAYKDSHPVTSIIQMTFLELTPLLANDFNTTSEDDVGL